MLLEKKLKLRLLRRNLDLPVAPQEVMENPTLRQSPNNAGFIVN